MAPSTPPPGYGPPVTPPPGQSPQAPHPQAPQTPQTPYPVQGQGHTAPTQPAQTYRPGPASQAHAPGQYPTGYPAQAQTYPGHLPPQGPTAPQPAKRRGGRVAAIAIAVALVVGIAGGGTAYFLLKDDGKSSQSSDSPKDNSTPKQGGSSSPGAEEGSGDTSADPKPSAVADPEPRDFPGINLTAGYHLTLGDEDVRPQDGEDGGYELSYDTGGYLDAEEEGGRLALLDPGQEGSLATCRSETRFTSNIYVDKLSKGRQICITTGTGHLALLTYQSHSPEDSASDYMTIDVTVWRNASG